MSIGLLVHMISDSNEIRVEVSPRPLSEAAADRLRYYFECTFEGEWLASAEDPVFAFIEKYRSDTHWHSYLNYELGSDFSLMAITLETFFEQLSSRAVFWEDFELDFHRRVVPMRAQCDVLFLNELRRFLVNLIAKQAGASWSEAEVSIVLGWAFHPNSKTPFSANSATRYGLVRDESIPDLGTKLLARKRDLFLCYEIMVELDEWFLGKGEREPGFRTYRPPDNRPEESNDSESTRYLNYLNAFLWRKLKSNAKRQPWECSFKRDQALLVEYDPDFHAEQYTGLLENVNSRLVVSGLFACNEWEERLRGFQALFENRSFRFRHRDGDATFRTVECKRLRISTPNERLQSHEAVRVRKLKAEATFTTIDPGHNGDELGLQDRTVLATNDVQQDVATAIAAFIDSLDSETEKECAKKWLNAVAKLKGKRRVLAKDWMPDIVVGELNRRGADANINKSVRLVLAIFKAYSPEDLSVRATSFNDRNHFAQLLIKYHSWSTKSDNRLSATERLDRQAQAASELGHFTYDVVFKTAIDMIRLPSRLEQCLKRVKKKMKRDLYGAIEDALEG